MPVLINFKICDNSPDCNGIAVCPTKALYWNELKKTISYNESKCILCGKCEKVCEVKAIHVAKTKKEAKEIRKKIDLDPRKVFDLFVDRYGAEPQDKAFIGKEEKFEMEILKSTNPAVAELFNENSINCLIHSIPIKELFEKKDILYRKIEAKNNLLLKKYSVKKLPALLFFNKGKLIGKIEGKYEVKQKKELKEKINEIMKKINF